MTGSETVRTGRAAAFRLGRVIALLLLGPAAVATSAVQPGAPPVINQCNITGGVNYGRQMLACTHSSEEMVLLRPRPGQAEARVRDTDGSFLQEFVYRIPEPLTVDFQLCGRDILSVDGASLSGGAVVTRRLPTDRPACFKRRFIQISGLFALAVRTRGPDSDIDIDTYAVSSIPPPPVFIPPPPPILPPPPAPP